MNERVYIPPTKRRAMTKARATRIFLSRDGICVLCEQRINAARDKWFIEHPESLAQGGSDDDADLWPAHERCKPAKDAADAASKAKRDRLVTKGWTGKAKSKRGFQTNRDSSIKMTILHGPVDRRTGEPIGRRRG